jgi:hypothetical protein
MAWSIRGGGMSGSNLFVYWLEKTTEKLGSIWDVSAFKWCIKS